MDPGSPCTPENNIRKRKLEDGRQFPKFLKLQENRGARDLAAPYRGRVRKDGYELEKEKRENDKKKEEVETEAESEDDDVIEVLADTEIINLVSDDEDDQETPDNRKNSKKSGDHQESRDTDFSDNEDYECDVGHLIKTEMDCDDSDEEGYDWEDD